MTHENSQPPVTQEPGGTSTDPRSLASEHPADVAEFVQALPPEQGADILAAMPPAVAGEALGEMDAKDAERYVADMHPQAAAGAVGLMAPDDAADLLGELSEQHRERILAELPTTDRAELEQLLKYPAESAGGIMSPEVTALPDHLTVPQAIARLRRIAGESEQIYYTYVVDDANRLVGVLSLRDLILAPEDQRINEIMIGDVVTVPAMMDREEVARLLSKYGYFALPVIDAQQRLLGIVTVDDVVGIIQEEATEDMQRMVGAGGDERVNSPVPFVLRRRIPWLVLNLGTAFLAAFVVGAFEQTLKSLTALAVLLPIVAGQAGNTGLQSMAVMIRGIATGETRGLALAWVLLREAGIGLGAGLLIGVTCALGCFLWRRELGLSIVLGSAMIGCMLLATISGALIPWLMKRLGLDPAQSAGIVLTTITDVSGFAIFLGLGSLLVSAGK
jgi:magnesium transporter